ncbi:hypothetical protein MRX96_013906 [Rhipicephalus microplus]
MAALPSVKRREKATMGTALPATQLATIQDAGCQVLLPAHVDIPENEEVDTLANGAHHTEPPLSIAVMAADFSRYLLR